MRCGIDHTIYRESGLDIYVINLDRDVQRLRWMEQQLSAHKLEFTRIAAVNGAIDALQIPIAPTHCGLISGAAESAAC